MAAPRSTCVAACPRPSRRPGPGRRTPAPAPACANAPALGEPARRRVADAWPRAALVRVELGQRRVQPAVDVLEHVGVLGGRYLVESAELARLRRRPERLRWAAGSRRATRLVAHAVVRPDSRLRRLRRPGPTAPRDSSSSRLVTMLVECSRRSVHVSARGGAVGGVSERSLPCACGCRSRRSRSSSPRSSSPRSSSPLVLLRRGLLRRGLLRRLASRCLAALAARLPEPRRTSPARV